MGWEFRGGFGGFMVGHPLGEWRRGVWGSSAGGFLLKKTPVSRRGQKGRIGRWPGTLCKGVLRGGWLGEWQWMPVVAELLEQGFDFGSNRQCHFHEGATLGAASRVAAIGVLEQPIPRDAHLFGKNLGLLEQGVGQGQELASEPIGQEAVITDDPEMRVWNMGDEAGDKIQDWESELRLFLGIMIEVCKGDLLAVVGEDSGFSQRRPFEVAAEIFQRGLPIGRLVVEMDHPFFSVKLIEPGVEGAVIAQMSEFTWELQLPLLMLTAKEGDDLVAPHDFELFVVKKAFGDPALAILGEAAHGGGEMEVKIAFEIPPEGMAGLKDARIKALVAGQFQNELGGQGWNQVEEVAIVPEKLPQVGGHGKGDMLPRGIRQNVEVGFDPFIGGLLPARGTEPRFAGVRNGCRLETLGTLLQMGAQQQGFAGHHFGHVEQDAEPHLAGMQAEESLPVIQKDGPQADFAADKFHACLIEQNVSRGKEKVAALAA